LRCAWVDDDGLDRAPVAFLGVGKEIRAEFDEALPEVTYAVGGEFAAVLAGHQVYNPPRWVLTRATRARSWRSRRITVDLSLATPRRRLNYARQTRMGQQHRHAL
jgi:hypothetical protein